MKKRIVTLAIASSLIVPMSAIAADADTASPSAQTNSPAENSAKSPTNNSLNRSPAAEASPPAPLSVPDAEALEKSAPPKSPASAGTAIGAGGFLGISGVTSLNVAQPGVVVMSVFPASPAEAAGVQPGDLVTAADGHPLRTFEQLTHMVQQNKAGDEMTLQVVRMGQPMALAATLASRPTAMADSLVPQPPESGLAFSLPPDAGMFPNNAARQSKVMIGVQLQPIDAAMQRRLGTKEDAGVVVANVLPGSPADKAGIEAADVILAVDGTPVRTSSEVMDIVASKNPGETLSIELLRDGLTMTEKVPVEARPQPAGAMAVPGLPLEMLPGLTVPGIPLVPNASAPASSQQVEAMQRQIDMLQQQVRSLQEELESVRAGESK